MKIKYFLLGKKNCYLLILALILAVCSCEIDKPDTPEEGNKIKVTDPIVLDSSYRSATIKTYIYCSEDQEISQVGHIWSTDPRANIALIVDTRANEGKYDHNEDGSFTSELFDLSPGTKYYVWAYAHFGNTTVYSPPTEFSTIGIVAPSVSIDYSNLTDRSVTISCEVLEDGGDVITLTGICWSRNPNPTSSSPHIEQTGNSTTFTNTINGLDPNTNYYIRAYARNSAGKFGYSTSSTILTHKLTDIDNNEYNTVRIGTQVWMAENLKTTKYSERTNLEDGTGNSDIWGDYSTEYYFAYEDNSTNASTYGYLYTWAAAMHNQPSSNSIPSGIQGVCPDGWHLPSDAEWDILINFLGGADVAGVKMREAGPAHWGNDNTGTNTSGFTALPAGIRNPNDGDGNLWFGLGIQTHFMTSTESSTDSDHVIQKAIWGSTASDLSTNDWFLKNHAYSVRCVMD
ncbi:MAG: fibronectin type III domain-containing protein [Bacteroidales bacterium]|nr:fibronectin type III domain-containing protein [Bacteroidales bacterium]